MKLITELPPSVATSPALNEDQQNDLSALRGTFAMGHTDDDATGALGQVRDLTGRHLAILWDFDDCWGLGGNSDIVEVDAQGRVRDCPSEWREFLYEKGSKVTADQLSAAQSGDCLKHHERLHWSDDFNLFRRKYEGEAPKC